MPANAKEVKIRISTIKNTRKITKAMEMVAAAKMRRATQGALETRNYHSLTTQIMEKILESPLFLEPNNPSKRFFEDVKNPKNITIIVFASNRGLCGAFNSSVIKQVLSYLGNSDLQVSLITVGNKATSTFNMLGAKIDLAYKKEDNATSDESISEIVEFVYNKFKNKQTDKVLVAYTDYKSAIAQNATTKQLFPFSKIAQVGLGQSDVKMAEPIKSPKNIEYLYEPDRFELLNYLVSRVAQVELYQALLESNASEHSARMVAMKNASDSASEMLDEFVLEFNKARQALITKEIAEISAGRAAIG